VDLGANVQEASSRFVALLVRIRCSCLGCTASLREGQSSYYIDQLGVFSKNN